MYATIVGAHAPDTMFKERIRSATTHAIRQACTSSLMQTHLDKEAHARTALMCTCYT